MTYEWWWLANSKIKSIKMRTWNVVKTSEEQYMILPLSRINSLRMFVEETLWDVTEGECKEFMKKLDEI